jgi:hypothetical protein
MTWKPELLLIWDGAEKDGNILMLVPARSHLLIDTGTFVDGQTTNDSTSRTGLRSAHVLHCVAAKHFWHQHNGIECLFGHTWAQGTSAGFKFHLNLTPFGSSSAASWRKATLLWFHSFTTAMTIWRAFYDYRQNAGLWTFLDCF